MVEPLNTKAMTAADLVEMIAHKEQVGIWANEIATAISLGDMLKEDWSFDDSVDLEREIVAQLRDVLSSAFSHPAYDIATLITTQQHQIAALMTERTSLIETKREQIASVQAIVAEMQKRANRWMRACMEAREGCNQRSEVIRKWVTKGEALESRLQSLEEEVKRLRLEKQAMHRRAQKAEGAVLSARYEASVWRSVLKRNELPHWLSLKVLDSVDRGLSRAALKENGNG